jgi:integrase
MVRRLTPMEIRALKPDAGKRREVPCGPPNGLYCIVHSSGKKSFALRYRFNGRPRKLTFDGSFPALPLVKARASADAALSKLGDGVDPALDQERRPSEGFSSVVDEFIERYVKARKRKSGEETERILKREAVSAWAKRPINSITRTDVLRLLDKIVDRGSPIMANRTRAALSKLFRWSIERGLIESSPITGTSRPAEEQDRDRVLSDDELAAIYQAADELGYPYGPHIQLLTLTAQRLNEVARMTWEQVDVGAALWTLPRAETKAKRIHDVPLSSSALAILKSLPRFKAGQSVFTTTSGAKPINGFSKAKLALDAAIQKSARDDFEVKPWRLHDLRRSATTWLAKNGTEPHVLAALLNHAPASTMGITAIYNRTRYSAERRAALELWSTHVAKLANAGNSELVAVG